ncbi:hypothetical protein GCM10009765_78330 [Fodinicola feengrottensis]|uniref:Secreted protein n=1 Tax=Fodinicola feengrottensis TaxID=435914 RepID=A0ABN2J547_9ACTN
MTLTGLGWIVLVVVVIGLGMAVAGGVGIFRHRQSVQSAGGSAPRQSAGSYNRAAPNRATPNRAPNRHDHSAYDDYESDRYEQRRGAEHDDQHEPFGRNRSGAVTRTWVPGGGDPMNDETAVIPRYVEDEPPPPPQRRGNPRAPRDDRW